MRTARQETEAARVGIVVPFYGNAADLRGSLESLAAENYPHEVILVDDGNEPPVNAPQKWHPAVTVIRHASNRGITAALNSGMKHACSSGYRYIGRLDAGDHVVPGRIATQVQFLEQHPECKLVGGHAIFVTPHGKRLFRFAPPCEDARIRRQLHRRCCFLHPTVMFRADVFEKVGFYRELYPAAEDYDLFFRIAEQFPTANIPQVLLEYEVSADSISSRRRRLQVISKFRIVLAHFDARLPDSYRGVLEALIAMAIPRRLIMCARGVMARLTGHNTVIEGRIA